MKNKTHELLKTTIEGVELEVRLPLIKFYDSLPKEPDRGSYGVYTEADIFELLPSSLQWELNNAINYMLDKGLEEFVV